MRLALKEARSGLGLTAPNPSVGCVIVCNGEVVSSSRTSNNGRPHSEEKALQNLSSEILSTSTMYITLEPCCHRNIKAQTCVEKIISSKIPKIVIGAIDPNPNVNSKSIELLRNNNLEVITGILKDECEELISGFKSRVLNKRPYITLKLAMSLDAKIALKNGHSKWITSAKQRAMGHELRAQHDAIITGIETVLYDDPLLTVRLPQAQQKPIRVILDSNLRINPNMRIYKDSDTVKTIVFHSADITKKLKNIEYYKVVRDQHGLSLSKIVAKLAEIGINNLLVEAGQKLVTSFIKQNLVDKLVVFSANKILGDDGLSVIGPLSLTELKSAPEFETIFIRD
jgi:diaminohydroxyphosphoribosylaminopyrimidine deaminase/5-amino-6-(5-phosphoribosylamino)uracil reductase